MLTAGGTTSLSFGSVPVGSSSDVQGFTITNRGQQISGAITVTLSGGESGDFEIQEGSTDDCVSGATMLVPGGSCDVRIVFTPTVNGIRTGNVTFPLMPGYVAGVTLSGTGGCSGNYLSDGKKCVAMAGVVWTQRASRRTWQAVASSSDGTKLVAAVSGGYVFISADSGVTWTQAGSQQNWISVASSSDGSKLVAAASPGAIYTSADSGATWTQRESQQAAWSSVASSSDGTRLAAARGMGMAGYIFMSTDSGATWTQTG
jgi:hypothetical protein